MPVYEFECPEHGRFQEIIGYDKFVRVHKCPKCRIKARLVPSIPARHVVDFIPGWNGGAGEYFDTKKDRENWLVESGSRRLR